MAADEDAAAAELDRYEARIRAELGDLIFGVGEQTMDSASDVLEDQSAFAKRAWEIIDELGYGEEAAKSSTVSKGVDDLKGCLKDR